MKVVWMVEYCGYGGQTCVPMYKLFDDILAANAFFKKVSDISGHTCKSQKMTVRLVPEKV